MSSDGYIKFHFDKEKKGETIHIRWKPFLISKKQSSNVSKVQTSALKAFAGFCRSVSEAVGLIRPPGTVTVAWNNQFNLQQPQL